MGVQFTGVYKIGVSLYKNKRKPDFEWNRVILYSKSSEFFLIPPLNL